MRDIEKATSGKALNGPHPVALRPKVKIVETFSYPKTKRITLEPLPDELVDQLLTEADQLFAQAKNKALGK